MLAIKMAIDLHSKIIERLGWKVYQDVASSSEIEEYNTALRHLEEWYDIGREIEQNNRGLDVVVSEPLSHYRVIDAVQLGPNITVYTIPDAYGNYRVNFEDKLRPGRRPIKVAGKWTTGPGTCTLNAATRIAGATLIGGLLGSASTYMSTKIAPSLARTALAKAAPYVPVTSLLGSITITEVTGGFFDSTPACGSTEVLYDLLHLVYDERGRVEEAQVYRVNLRISSSGNIQVMKDNVLYDDEYVNGFWYLGNAKRDFYTGEWVW